MTLFERKTFTVPASGSRDPKTCGHGMLDRRGYCVFCGDPILSPPPKPNSRDDVG